MPSGGGLARRMTWLGPDAIVRGWTPEGHILFVSTYGQPFFRNYRAFTLDPAGGMPQLMPYGQVNHLALRSWEERRSSDATPPIPRAGSATGRDGGALVDRCRRKRPVPAHDGLAGNVTSPMWIGDRVFFLSDCRRRGQPLLVPARWRDRRRHTDHDDFYARHAQTDGKRIVYQCGAELWLFDPATDGRRLWTCGVPSHRTQAARRFVARRGLSRRLPRASGQATAWRSDARGKLFSFPLWEGAVRQHGGERDGVRYRLGQWLEDGAELRRRQRRVG